MNQMSSGPRENALQSEAQNEADGAAAPVPGLGDYQYSVPSRNSPSGELLYPLPKATGVNLNTSSLDADS